MSHRIIRYKADDLEMVSHLYAPDNKKPRAGVLVFPEALGLGEHACSRADRLAQEGYAVLACDYYGDGRIVEMADLQAAIGPLWADRSRVRSRAQGGLTALLNETGVDANKIAAIGYCFGGTTALELARSGATLAATVGFHSGLTMNMPSTGSINGKVLVCIGADDPSIPPEQRNDFEREMREAKADWRMNLYGGVVHSFTNPAADAFQNPGFARYDAEADAHSWSDMLALFDNVFA